VFDNRVLRRVSGPKKDEVTGGWRKLHNEELHGLYSSPNIIAMIKSRMMRSTMDSICFSETLVSTYKSAMKTETICYFETIISTYKSTRRYNAEEQQRHLHRRENLKSNIGYRFRTVAMLFYTKKGKYFLELKLRHHDGISNTRELTSAGRRRPYFNLEYTLSNAIFFYFV
jgi:hypothetical protein